MDLMQQSEDIRYSVLTLCNTAGFAESLLQTVNRGEQCPILSLALSSTNVKRETSCEIMFSAVKESDSSVPEFSVPDQPVCVVTSSAHSIEICIAGLPQARQQHSASFPPVLNDLCRIASHINRVVGIKQLKVQCDQSTVERLLDSVSQPRLLDDVAVKHFLSSAFVFCHLVRVPGETQMESSLDLDAGRMTVKVGDEPSCPLKSIISSCLNGEDTNCNEEIERCIAHSSESSVPVYLCILFNDIITCEWYLKTRETVDNQRKRLPNHDTTRIRVESKDSQLTIRFTLFDFHHEDYFRATGALSADQVLKEFSDDHFLSSVIPKCEQLAQSHSFNVELFTVPGRNTIHLLQSAAEIAQKAQMQDDGLSLPTSVSLHQAAAAGDSPELARVLDSSPPSVLQDPLESFPHRTALLCAAAASVTDFSKGCETHAECAQLLIDRGADPGATDSRKHSVLHCAVLSANIHLTRVLLERKSVDINCTDESGMSPLLLAVEEENATIAEVLLDNGAECELADKAGRSPLALAVASGNNELVRILVEHEPQLLLESGARKFSSIYWAAWKQGHRDICLFLLQ